VPAEERKSHLQN